MKENLKIATIQTELFWEDKVKNYENFNRLIDSIEEPVDLILLPEMFNTGFSINPELAEDVKEVFRKGGLLKSPSIEYLIIKSKQKKAAIMATLMVKENDMIYNRLVFVPYHKNEAVTLMYYDKRHLFCLSDENKLLKRGHVNKIFHIKGWRIMPQICYDLRFPVWCRNELYPSGEFKYDALVYLANWPKIRTSHWYHMLRSRAIENQSYVIGVNRIGVDGRDIDHSGGTSIISYDGETMYMCNGIEDVHIDELNYQDLYKYREALPISKDWDREIGGTANF